MNPELFRLMRLASEARQTLNDLPDDATDEAVTEAREGYQSAETELRTALAAAEDEPESRTSAGSDVDRLIGRAELRSYLQAAATDRAVTGAEAELNQELGLDDRSVMPWEMLLDAEERTEDRQDAPSALEASAVGHPQMSILSRVFRRTDAMFTGVTMPMVARGEPIYPVLKSVLAGGMFAPGAGVEAEKATFTGVSVEPTRASARYLFRVEDAARLSGMESALARDLRATMGILMDSQVVGGDGQGDNLSGFLTHAAAAQGNAPAAVATVKDFDEAIVGGIDGLYAYSRNNVSLLVGVETQRLIDSVRLPAAQAASTIREAVVRAGIGGLRGTSQVAAGDVQNAYRFVRNGLQHVAPVWQGINIIRDPYTGASEGQIALTAMMLFGYAMIRNNGVQTVRFKNA